MIFFEEALEIIQKLAKPVLSEKVSLEKSLGRVLAVDVFSDMDMPPFNKSAVDGYACRRNDLAGELIVLETIPAGKSPTRVVGPGECSKLMTGGMLPLGADTVIMVEDVELTGPDTIRFIAEKTSSNYCSRAEDIRQGEKVLSAGTHIRPQEVAVLASVGCAFPEVYKQPVIGIISTGDEIVEPIDTPAESQIRNSNAYQLMAQALQANCKPAYFGIARDNREATLELIIKAGIESDIVILTGGISAGDFDFVPGVIEQAGYEIKFRQLAVQPGKPVIFAIKGNKYLIALPGNPVSSFVQFELLVKYLVKILTGDSRREKQIISRFGCDYIRKKASRKAFFPVCFTPEGNVVPVDYHGSAHIHSYIQAEGIVTIEIGETEIKKGTPVNVRLI